MWSGRQKINFFGVKYKVLQMENTHLLSVYGEDFMSPIDDDLLCLICQHPLREPVLTRYGHRFCRQCLEQQLARFAFVSLLDGHSSMQVIYPLQISGYHVSFTQYWILIECSKPTRFFIVILMYNNVGCSASFEIRQKNVIGRTFIQGFYPWALTQPERFEDKK